MPTVRVTLKRCISTQKLGQDAAPLRVVQLVFEGAIEDDAVLAELTAFQRLTEVAVSVEPVSPRRLRSAITDEERVRGDY